jgi:FkbM family methyltransferase
MYFDIGANDGKWSLANINYCDKIIAVEASPITFQKLCKSCKNNEKIIPVNYAACKNEGNDITFYECRASTLSTINKDWLENPSSRFYNHQFITSSAKTITIDKLIEQYGIPDLIKIDVECGEYECITSLTKKVDTLCFEWASEFNNITFNCINYLITLGFTKFYLQFGDEYTFKPKEEDYIQVDDIIKQLNQTVLKIDWGMVWVK